MYVHAGLVQAISAPHHSLLMLFCSICFINRGMTFLQK